MNKLIITLLAFATGTTVSVSAQQPPAMPNMNDYQDALNAIGQMMQTQSSNTTELVNFRQLKALLPASLDGMKRTNASGEKTGGFGMTVAFAEADYEGDDGSRISIKITDGSAMGPMLAMSHAAWSNMEIDRESDTEMEQTFKHKGHKALKRFNFEDEDGEVNMIIDSRFILEVAGFRTTLEALMAALEKIDLDALLSLEAPAE